MQEMLTQAAPAIVVMALTLGLVGVVLIVRRRLGGGKRAAEIVAEQRRERESAIQQQAAAAVAPPTRRQVQPEAILVAIPDFDLSEFCREARELFRAVQLARGQAHDFSEQMLPGALEVAMGSGLGLERTHEIRILATRVVRAAGTVDGCDVRVEITALIEETRSGKPHLSEVCEEWRWGWPPVLGRWRVLQVERQWRRTVERPVVNPEGHQPAAKPSVAPDLEQRSQELEVDADTLEAMALLAVDGWAQALVHADARRLEGLATPAFQAAVAGELSRLARFQMELQWSVRVDSVALVRLMADAHRRYATVWVHGVEAIRLSGSEPQPSKPHDLPWARYLDFQSAEGGPWLLDGQVDDEHWVV